jgi:hypothetical protein
VLVAALEERYAFCPHGLFPPTPSHGARFSRADYDDQLADAEHLHVYDVGSPCVRLLHLADIEKDWFGALTGPLLVRWILEEFGYDTPDRGCVGLIAVVLCKIECSRTI